MKSPERPPESVTKFLALGWWNLARGPSSVHKLGALLLTPLGLLALSLYPLLLIDLLVYGARSSLYASNRGSERPGECVQRRPFARGLRHYEDPLQIEIETLPGGLIHLRFALLAALTTTAAAAILAALVAPFLPDMALGLVFSDLGLEPALACGFAFYFLILLAMASQDWERCFRQVRVLVEEPGRLQAWRRRLWGWESIEACAERPLSVVLLDEHLVVFDADGVPWERVLVAHDYATTQNLKRAIADFNSRAKELAQGSPPAPAPPTPASAWDRFQAA